MEILSNILTTLSVNAPLLILWIGRKNRGHYLWIFSLFAIMLDYFLTYLKVNLNYNTQLGGNLYVICEFLVYSYFLTFALDYCKKTYLKLISVLIIFFIVIHYPASILEFNGYGAATFSLAYIILSILFFRKVLIDLSSKNILKSPSFWFTLGIFIYAASNFFIFLVQKSLHKENAKMFELIWKTAFNSTTILKCMFLSFGFYYLNKTTLHDKVRYN